MRAELATAAGGVLASVAPPFPDLNADDHVDLLAVANFVTLCRTACDYDYAGNVERAHQPEAPTRFVKQLAQIMRGAMANGLQHEKALALALRVAADSMPPMRLAIMRELASSTAGLSTQQIARGLDQPYTSVDKQLQSLHALRALSRVAQPTGKKTPDGTPKHMWVYTLKVVVPATLQGDTPAAPPGAGHLPLDEEVPF